MVDFNVQYTQTFDWKWSVQCNIGTFSMFEVDFRYVFAIIIYILNILMIVFIRPFMWYFVFWWMCTHFCRPIVKHQIMSFQGRWLELAYLGLRFVKPSYVTTLAQYEVLRLHFCCHIKVLWLNVLSRTQIVQP